MQNKLEKQINFLMYKSAEGNISVNVFVKDESIWLNQKGMAELFDCSTDNIGLHLKNIFASGELEKIQLPRISRQLPQMEKATKQNFTISMQ